MNDLRGREGFRTSRNIPCFSFLKRFCMTAMHQLGKIHGSRILVLRCFSFCRPSSKESQWRNGRQTSFHEVATVFFFIVSSSTSSSAVRSPVAPRLPPRGLVSPSGGATLRFTVGGPRRKLSHSPTGHSKAGLLLPRRFTAFSPPSPPLPQILEETTARRTGSK